MYGDSESHDLRAALATQHGVAPENIVVGEGIDGLLGNLVRLMVGPGDAVVTSDGAYPTFNYHVAGFGGVLHKVPYRDDHEDPDALLARARAVGAKLVYLANPDNPMGSWHGAARVQAMIDATPSDTLLVLDEAYVEFAPDGTAPQMRPDTPNVIRMRTFSKGYGMAGLRVGYAIAHRDLVALFDRVRNHFGIGRIAQAGALAALKDADHLADVRAQVARARDTLADIAARNGLRALPSATNFVAIDCGNGDERARAILGALMAQDIFVRMPFVAPQNRCIRVSVGDAAALDAFAQALPVALRKAGQTAR